MRLLDHFIMKYHRALHNSSNSRACYYPHINNASCLPLEAKVFACQYSPILECSFLGRVVLNVKAKFGCSDEEWKA